jgi:hypothetical protein
LDAVSTAIIREASTSANWSKAPCFRRSSALERRNSSFESRDLGSNWGFKHSWKKV